MIPKIVHYCWLSKDEHPKIVRKCLASWRDKLPDYQFILWDADRFDVNSNLWTKQAFAEKKYAFAADYIRLHAIYEYGGIYLDTDVEVLKRFDDLLDLPYFIGCQFDNLIEAAVFGAEKKSDWVLDCLKYYKNRPFIKKNGQFDMMILPEIMQLKIKEKRKLVTLDEFENEVYYGSSSCNNNFFLFPYEYFSPKNHQTRKVLFSKKSYTIHHYNSAWLPLISKIRLNFVRRIGLENTEKLIRFLSVRKLNNLHKGKNTNK